MFSTTVRRSILLVALAQFLVFAPGINSFVSAQDTAQSSNDSQIKLQQIVGNDEITKKNVQGAQQLLTELGYEPGPVDGILGARTQTALKKWKEESQGQVAEDWLSPPKQKQRASGSQTYYSSSGQAIASPTGKCKSCEIYKNGSWQCVDRATANAHKGPAACGRLRKNTIVKF